LSWAALSRWHEPRAPSTTKPWYWSSPVLAILALKVASLMPHAVIGAMLLKVR